MNPPKSKKMIAKKASRKKDNVPVFLQKSYNMINTCDPNIAGWSDDGYTFIIKEPEVFAAEVIPQFFKHNKFTSFVRQLNFYGFRKIRSDSVRLPEDHPQANWWRFRHEFFLRGRPDLLEEIKKSIQINCAEQHEVEKLKEEVSYLRAEMGNLSEAVQQMSRQLDASPYAIEEPANKKQKFEVDHIRSVSELPPLDPLESMDFRPDADRLSTNQAQRRPSAVMVESMFDFVNDGTGSVFRPDAVNSSSQDYDGSVSYNDGDSQTGQLDPKLSAKLNYAVSSLPKSLQESFVERLVDTIASPESYRKHVEAVSVLATAAAIEAENRTQSDVPSSDDTGTTTLPVAAAALGAFLASYSSA